MYLSVVKQDLFFYLGLLLSRNHWPPIKPTSNWVVSLFVKRIRKQLLGTFTLNAIMWFWIFSFATFNTWSTYLAAHLTCCHKERELFNCILLLELFHNKTPSVSVSYYYRLHYTFRQNLVPFNHNLLRVCITFLHSMRLTIVFNIYCKTIL